MATMSDRPVLLYILAPSYSGSTLLTYLLAQHSAISTIGELKATSMGDIDKYQCSCGELIRECGFWNDVKRKADDSGIEFSVDEFKTVYRGKTRPVHKVVHALVRNRWFERVRSLLLGVFPESLSRLRETSRQNFVLSQIVCELQEGPIFMDGSKDSTRLLHMMRSDLWDVKVIYLQRDGRGVVNSYLKHDNIDEQGAVHYWIKAMRELQNMRARLQDEMVFDLHYEELCKNPRETLAAIAKWLGVDESELQQMDFRSNENHILGNGMRLGNVGEIRFDESWREKLSEDALTYFAEHAADINKNIGYAA